MSVLQDHDPKADRIHRLPMFRDADKKALAHLATAADEVTVEAGHTLISQGHNHSEVFVVEQGTAAVIVNDEKVAEIPEGEMIGELGIFARGPASATVRAHTEMTLLVIPYNRIDQILDENPAMLRAVAEELASRLRAMDENW